jgi:hypothetical protein
MKVVTSESVHGITLLCCQRLIHQVIAFEAIPLIKPPALPGDLTKFHQPDGYRTVRSSSWFEALHVSKTHFAGKGAVF